MRLPDDVAHGAVNNRFVGGNPLTGKRATVCSPEVLNALVWEISNTITAAGFELDPAKEDQLPDAILTLVIRTMRQGGSVCIDHGDVECDGGELDDDGNLIADTTQTTICYPVTVDQDLTIDQLKTELENYDDIDGGAL